MRIHSGLGVLVVVAVGACSSSSGDSSTPTGGPKGTGKTTSVVIGASGGSLVHPEGLTLTVPAGALTADATITATTSTDGPPGSFASWSSPVFRLTPADLTFAAPATVAIAYTGAPTNPALYWATGAGASFTALPAIPGSSTVSAPIASLGSGFVAPAAPPTTGGDACAPYVGDYAGILEFKWSYYDAPSECLAPTPRSGIGTITVHFTTTCLGPGAGGNIVLNVTTVSTDDAYFQNTTSGPANPTFSQMVMPPNPPASSNAAAISLGFNHGTLGLGPKITVTTGAAKIASDVGVTDGWLIDVVPGDDDNAGYWPAGLPKPIGSVVCAKVDSRTFKIDKL